MIFRPEIALRLILLFALSTAGLAAEVPLPVPRPPEFAAPAPQPPADVPVPPIRPLDLDMPDIASVPTTPEIAGACQALFADGHVLGSAAPPVSGPGGCGITGAVDLKGIVLADGSSVALHPSLVLRCSLAAAVAGWVRDDLAPAFAADGSPLIALEDVGGYQCRNRDRLAGEQLSEHGLGNALDIGTFARRSGATLTLRAVKPSPLMTRLRDSACQRFDTVLGPGSDSFHADHLHVDLRVRRSGAHICQWDLPAP